MRTAPRSLVARDIRSPVRVAWKYASGSRSQMGVERVPDVVLDGRARRSSMIRRVAKRENPLTTARPE